MLNPPKPLSRGLEAKGRHPLRHVGERHSLRARSVLLWLLAVLVLSSAATTAFAQGVPCPPPPNSPNYPCVYVADSNGNSGTVSVISAATNNVIGSITVSAPLLSGLAVTPDNALVYVGGQFQQGDGEIAVIDTNTGALSTKIQPNPFTILSSPSQLAISPDGRFVWVAEPPCDGCSAGVEVIDTGNNNARISVNGLSVPESVALSPDGTQAYVADVCNKLACVIVINTADYTVANTIEIPNSNPNTGYSISVTPDGSLVCVSFSAIGVAKPGFAVAFIDPSSNGTVSTAYSDILTDGPSDYGMGITPTGDLYAAAPTQNGVSLNSLYKFNTSKSYIGTIGVGGGPTGVAVGSDGQTIYVTNAGTFQNAGDTVTVLRSGATIATLTVGLRPQGIAAMPSIPPSITTQPASQTIPYGGTATLTVAATGTPPLTYQWYQGQSGDTSNPVQGGNGTSFTTPPLTMTTSYWVRVTNIVAGANGDSTTATVTVQPPVPPVITTQPADQIMGMGSEATLSVQATGNPPQSYQWFQGQSGDTSMPLQGATGNTFTTPPLNANTSYWVQVTNIGGSVNSNTATVTVGDIPTCVLTLQAAGGSPTAVTANATCTDKTMPPLALTTTLDWGDNSPTVTVSGGTLIATHTYANVAAYHLLVTSTNTANLTGMQPAILDLRPVDIQPPLSVFQGQSASFTANVSSPGSPAAPVKVNFECIIVVDSNNNVRQASDVGISCYAISQPITIPANGSVAVTIVIQTSGGGLARLSRPKHPGVIYAFVVPAFGLLFLPGGASLFIRRRNLQRLVALFGILSILVIITSCGGGFTPPHNQAATPPDTYHVSVIDVLADNSAPPGAFVQTTLIVPLTVTPFQ